MCNNSVWTKLNSYCYNQRETTRIYFSGKTKKISEEKGKRYKFDTNVYNMYSTNSRGKLFYMLLYSIAKKIMHNMYIHSKTYHLIKISKK